MADTTISSGQTVSNLTVSKGEIVTVQSGGTINGAVVSSGGTISANSGSIYSGTITVNSTGFVNYGILAGGAVETVNAGGFAYNQYIASGATLNDYGTLKQTNIDGGTLNVYSTSGNQSFQFAEGAGGTLNIFYSAAQSFTASNTAGYALSGRTINVGSNATYSNGVAGSGGTVILNGAGKNLTISGGTVDLYNKSGSTINFASGATGALIVESGTSFGSVTLASGQALSAKSGGKLAGGTVLSGGSVVVSSGGTLSGTLNVASGGNVSLPFINSGATINLSSGGVLAGGETVSRGGTLNAASDVVLTGTIVNSGTISGGILSGAGTTEDVASSATISGQTIGSGASATIDAFVAKAANLTLSGGTLVLGTGRLSGLSIDGSSGTLILNSAGVVTLGSSAILSNGNKVFVNSSGTLNGATIADTGVVSMTSGATVSGTTVSSGGLLVVQGRTSNTNVKSGGTIEYQSGTTTVNTYISAGANVIVDSGFTFNQNGMGIKSLASGATVTVRSGGILQSQNLQPGANAIIESGGLLTGTMTVSSGAAAVLNGPAGSGAINLVGNGAGLFINGTDMPTNTISGFTTNDQIDLTSVPKSSISDVSRQNNQIIITTQNGTKYTLNAPGANKYGYSLIDDGHGGTIYTTCFAQGTLIATPEGEVAVERLLPGGLVNTPQGARPVKWLGHRAIRVADQRVPEENWLVRIRAGALADGVPARDLLVTQEHCMVFAGKLVPARMLVNGASIFIDRSIGEYTYHHVELDAHEAIWAEGALTESYLDTGNRDQFDNNAVIAAFPERNAGGSDSLPLDTSRDFVEPIHAAIAARASVVGLPPVLTGDANLHLITETGAIVACHRVSNGRHLFMLPDGVETVVLASRTSRPSDVIGPFVDDRRDLGVLVGEVVVFGATGRNRLDVHVATPTLPGWDVQEPASHRWTNGAAVLPVGRYQDGERRILAVQVLAAGPYRVAIGRDALAATA